MAKAKAGRPKSQGKRKAAPLVGEAWLRQQVSGLSSDVRTALAVAPASTEERRRTSPDGRFTRGDLVQLRSIQDIEDYNVKAGDIGIVHDGSLRVSDWPEGEWAVTVDFGRGLRCIGDVDRDSQAGDGVLLVGREHIEPVSGPTPRFTRVSAMDAVDRLFSRTLGEGPAWRRLEDILEGLTSRRRRKHAAPKRNS